MDYAEDTDAAVRTLAEFLYEQGFPPNRALDIAWVIAELPELDKAVFDADDR